MTAFTPRILAVSASPLTTNDTPEMDREAGDLTTYKAKTPVLARTIDTLGAMPRARAVLF